MYFVISQNQHIDGKLDHAVSASTVYLIRSMGTVWGVAVTAAILQTVLKIELPKALGDIPNKAEVCRSRSCYS